VSILFTWIYNNTGRSIFAALLFHASLNLSTFKLFPVFESQSAVPYYSLLILISVVIILIIWGRKNLVRQNKFS
ncbi:CPBP family intramembrane metalloprotease, partial [Patescibacteria group bacterium]|nr:CPBP family intramembrane metalloprotease [Patescibacteria group bacterium]